MEEKYYLKLNISKNKILSVFYGTYAHTQIYIYVYVHTLVLNMLVTGNVSAKAALCNIWVFSDKNFIINITLESFGVINYMIPLLRMSFKCECVSYYIN